MPTPYSPLVLPTLGTVNGQPTFATTATWITQCATAVNNAANGFMTALADLGAIEYSKVGDLPEFSSIVWLGNAAGVLNRPERPTLSLGNIQSLLNRLNQISPPPAVDEEFSYTDPGYSSALRDPMIVKLLNDLVNGGYGIDTADEVSLWNRARDREAKLGQANIEELRRQASGTSFAMPQGALYAALEKARQEAMEKVSSVNRDIALKRADLYVEQRRRVIDQVLQTESQSIALYNAVQARTLESAQVRVQMAVALFDAGVKLFAAQQEEIKVQIDARLNSLQSLVNVYAADISAYAAYVNAVASGAQIDIANSNNVLRRDIAEHESRVNMIKFRLQELGLTLDKNKEIYKYGSDFFRTALGAAMSNINGLAVQTGTT